MLPLAIGAAHSVLHLLDGVIRGEPGHMVAAVE
jgi:hypothetical protein